MVVWFDKIDGSMVYWKREHSIVICSAEIDDLIRAYEKEQVKEQEHDGCDGTR